MTKERKLAIDMWLWIREHYKEWDEYFWESGDEDDLALHMKCEFWDAEHKGERLPEWRGLCWLCQYAKGGVADFPYTCLRCPLKSCSTKNSAYYVLNLHLYKYDNHVSEEVYRNCCSTILNALGYKGE